MQSDNPDIQWALDLLKPDPLAQPSLISKYYHQIPCVVGAPVICGYVNHMRGLPVIARPHYLVLTLGGMLYASTWADWYYQKRAARTDAIMRDYIIRHPEDFPPPERQKYGEIFTKWIPIR
ncbi:uncharacterized protein LOC117181347 [Belonocnema kinseyi]|uniref:uncharacterized protein LOC117181347 n=1 Tax=Belonocnema kinseyi TaxID=2817044 RepID=UPI00143CFC29|nr:uncharacterized protein LOC117181347 [Belonocnema kinseyi]